jgi:DNA-binding Lrp family transcriptional regulator
VPMDEIDRAIVRASQAGLPLVRRPFDVIATRLGISGPEVMARVRRMSEAGIIRRIGAVPNHYALGLTANAMSVWDVEDEAVSRLGLLVGALPFVSHCYRRPRRLPLWPYNLFAMVHGKTRTEVAEKVAVIDDLLGRECRGRDILLSKRILKKTGLRLGA